MFGGYQACLADPFPAIACGRIFPEYSSWTRAMSVDFQRGGTSDLTFAFDFPPEQEAEIRRELREKGRSTPTFECGFYDQDGTLVTKIKNVVAIRPRGYMKGTSPPASGKEFASKTLEDIEALLRERILSAMHIKVAPDLSQKALLQRLKDRGLPSTIPVDRSGFEKYLAHLEIDKSLEPRQREDLFVLLDRDQNGRIDIEDFLSWWNDGEIKKFD